MNDESKNILIAVPDASYADMLAEIISGMGHAPVIAKNIDEARAYINDTIPLSVVVVDWELTQRYMPGLIELVNREMPCVGRYILLDISVENIKTRQETNEFCCYLKKPFDLEKFEAGVVKCIQEAKVTKETCECNHCLKFKTD